MGVEVVAVEGVATLRGGEAEEGRVGAGEGDVGDVEVILAIGRLRIQPDQISRVY